MQCIQLTSPSAHNSSFALKLLCPGSFSCYWLTHLLDFILIVTFPCLTLTLQKASCMRMCVCWQCCLSPSDLAVELCFYRLQRFYVLSSWETYRGVGGGGEDWWVTYHLMLPLLHNPFQKGESAEGSTELNNWRQREKEKRLPSP